MPRDRRAGQAQAFGDRVVQRFSWSRTAPYTDAEARAYFVEQEQARRRGEELNFACVKPACV